MSLDVEKMALQYEENTSAPTGTMIHCPVCGARFLKKTYHKKFCSNQDNGGSKRCKAIFWNEMRYHRSPK